MRKIILITIVILVFGALGIAFWYLGHKANTAPAENGGGQLPLTETSTTLPVVSSTSTPAGDTITIGTSKGTVVMKNFYKSAAIISPDGSGVLITDSPAYDISYATYDSSFAISLLQTPLAAVRAQAEAVFLQDLGISKEDACKLKATVEVPVSVDPGNAGINLGLSFCNGAFQPQ